MWNVDTLPVAYVTQWCIYMSLDFVLFIMMYIYTGSTNGFVHLFRVRSFCLVQKRGASSWMWCQSVSDLPHDFTSLGRGRRHHGSSSKVLLLARWLRVAIARRHQGNHAMRSLEGFASVRSGKITFGSYQRHLDTSTASFFGTTRRDGRQLIVHARQTGDARGHGTASFVLEDFSKLFSQQIFGSNARHACVSGIDVNDQEGSKGKCDQSVVIKERNKRWVREMK